MSECPKMKDHYMYDGFFFMQSGYLKGVIQECRKPTVLFVVFSNAQYIFKTIKLNLDIKTVFFCKFGLKNQHPVRRHGEIALFLGEIANKRTC